MHSDTKARDFSPAEKRAIMDRDRIDGWPCCVYCGAAAPSSEKPVWSNAHYISRAQGGLGIRENGLTLCPGCHGKYDQTTARKGMREFFREYLESAYPGWCEEDLIYHKGGNYA